MVFLSNGFHCLLLFVVFCSGVVVERKRLGCGRGEVGKVNDQKKDHPS